MRCTADGLRRHARKTYNKTDSDNKVALIFTASPPLYYNTTTNKLSIDLSDIYNKSDSDNK